MTVPARVCLAVLTLGLPLPPSDDSAEAYAATFDAHWETLRDEYPYFELYGVDWEAERAEHRPRALAAANDDEFAWELARMLCVLDDPHVSFVPPVETMMGRWGIPDIESRLVERRPVVVSWPEGTDMAVPEAFADDPHVYPEIVRVQGAPAQGVVGMLAAGPVGTSFEVTLRWPDGTETDATWWRPDESNLPPPDRHYGEGWLVTGRVGDVGYLRVRTFVPDKATLGPDGKMTTMLRAALRELEDTRALVIDLQGNGGGVVAASDPFLGNLLEETRSYRWGNAGGQKRIIRPRRPRYEGDVVVVVDELSASGGEWATRILRDAGRALVVGGRTRGAEAAVHTSEGPDGSRVMYSAWPMIEPGVKPFQRDGVEVDAFLPLTLADVREHGYDEALTRVRRARFAKALELLGAPPTGADDLLDLFDESERSAEGAVTQAR